MELLRLWKYLLVVGSADTICLLTAVANVWAEESPGDPRMIGKILFVAVLTVYNTFHFLLLDVSEFLQNSNRMPDFSQDLRKTSDLKEMVYF